HRRLARAAAAAVSGRWGSSDGFQGWRPPRRRATAEWFTGQRLRFEEFQQDDLARCQVVVSLAGTGDDPADTQVAVLVEPGETPCRKASSLGVRAHQQMLVTAWVLQQPLQREAWPTVEVAGRSYGNRLRLGRARFRLGLRLDGQRRVIVAVHRP